MGMGINNLITPTIIMVGAASLAGYLAVAGITLHSMDIPINGEARDIGAGTIMMTEGFPVEDGIVALGATALNVAGNQ